MRLIWLLAVSTSAVVGGGVFVSAQGPSAPPKRPFERLFTTTPAPRPAPSLAPRLMPPALSPSPGRCDAAVLRADTRIIRRVSIAPPTSRWLTLRDATKPGCR